MRAKAGNTNTVLDPVFILAIESSCDDTGAAVLRNRKVLSNVVAGQDVHQEFGGVVPELASRAHQQNIVPVVDQALKIAGIKKEQLSAIAFTEGPGLLGSLLVGATFAKTLALSLGIPLLAVDHMKGHILAHLIEDEKQVPEYPFLCLTVSGGHTQIIHVEGPLQMKVVGKTIDDAAGEAFDKAAKILGLDYPGGPLIDKYAARGNPLRFEFSTPKVDGYDFSFSGMKTSFLYLVQREMQKDPLFIENNLADICASYQRTIVEYLFQKLKLATTAFSVQHIALAGGVSANSELRKGFSELAMELNMNAHIPRFEYCTDNAAMIGIAGYFQYLNGIFADLSTTPKARLPF